MEKVQKADAAGEEEKEAEVMARMMMTNKAKKLYAAIEVGMGSACVLWCRAVLSLLQCGGYGSGEEVQSAARRARLQIRLLCGRTQFLTQQTGYGSRIGEKFSDGRFLSAVLCSLGAS